jgi:hypothetical protein
MQRLLEQYLSNNKMHSFEGPRGIRHLEQVALEVCGYKPDYSGIMYNFFVDNPGAIRAVIEWIGSTNNIDWRHNLEDLVGPEEDDEVGDLAPPVYDIGQPERPDPETGFSLFGDLK